MTEANDDARIPPACDGCSAEEYDCTPDHHDFTCRRLRDRDADTCPGAEKCHGCLKWCDVCGDVGDICHGDECDTHDRTKHRSSCGVFRLTMPYRFLGNTYHYGLCDCGVTNGYPRCADTPVEQTTDHVDYTPKAYSVTVTTEPARTTYRSQARDSRRLAAALLEAADKFDDEQP